MAWLLLACLATLYMKPNSLAGYAPIILVLICGGLFICSFDRIETKQEAENE